MHLVLPISSYSAQKKLNVFIKQLMATAKQVRTTSEFDELKSEIITWLNSELASRLKSPSTLVFHEILYAGSQVQSTFTEFALSVISWTEIFIAFHFIF